MRIINSDALEALRTLSDSCCRTCITSPPYYTKVASNIVSTQEATFSDDGISQQVVMKTGVTKKENAIIPNPVRLIPYRTFLEVEQPESEFVFRITEGRGGAPAFKLVSADGGRWEAVAVDNVKSYLMDALADIPNREQITIIA